MQTSINHNQKGFSLIEILIALTLLAMGGSFIVGKFTENLNEGKVNGTRIQMSNLEGRLKEFKRKCGFYPTTDQGLEALVSKPSGGRECKDYPSSGFIEGDELPKDSWDNAFQYESDGKTINIISLGADGQPGGEGVDADLSLKGKGGGGSGGAAKGAAPAAAEVNLKKDDGGAGAGAGGGAGAEAAGAAGAE